MRVSEVAARIHRHLCECPNHGYTQGDGRWGTGRGTEVLTIGGRKYTIGAGDYDCSSSTTYAWQKALEGTPYEGALGKGGYDSQGRWMSWYTGNMRSLFLSTGLFEWVPVSRAVRGDLYLNEGAHVAMCQGGGQLSEFLLNEYGTITGGTTGDQTGGESVVRGYWNFPWDGCLHCKRDIEVEDIEVVTDNDINKIANATANAVMNFKQNGVLVRDRIQGTDQAANGALKAANAARAALLDKADATGRGKKVDMPTRLAWVGKRMDDIQAEQASQRKAIEALGKKLDQLIKAVG